MDLTISFLKILRMKYSTKSCQLASPTTGTPFFLSYSKGSQRKNEIFETPTSNLSAFPIYQCYRVIVEVVELSVFNLALRFKSPINVNYCLKGMIGLLKARVLGLQIPLFPKNKNSIAIIKRNVNPDASDKH